MKILMVCLGNICRSPLAHGIVEHLAEQEGLDWHVESAGTGSWHVGQAPDKRTIEVAKKNGIDISRQRARHFHPAFFDQYDHIFVMDEKNYENVMAQAKSPEHRAKVSYFMNEGIVEDPYFDDKLFDPVFEQIHARSKELIETLKGNV